MSYTTTLWSRDGSLISQRQYETLARAAQLASSFLMLAGTKGVKVEVRDAEGKVMWTREGTAECRL